MTFDQRLQDELIGRVRAVVEPAKVILFGSVARGDTRRDSDVDILVVVPPGTERTATARRIYRNLIGYSVPVDVVVATQQDLDDYGQNKSLVFYPALKEGRLIYVQ